MRTARRRIKVAGLFGIIAGLAVACGSSSGSDGGSTEAFTCANPTSTDDACLTCETAHCAAENAAFSSACESYASCLEACECEDDGCQTTCASAATPACQTAQWSVGCGACDTACNFFVSIGSGEKAPGMPFTGTLPTGVTKACSATYGYVVATGLAECGEGKPVFLVCFEQSFGTYTCDAPPDGYSDYVL